uniref:Uncharacterized protein n=1 Tax=Rhizophora mucronata TaxID=61149 RepID=A0A2P2NXF6_RHIMU
MAYLPRDNHWNSIVRTGKEEGMKEGSREQITNGK